MEDDVDISALTIEQYIALIPNDIKPGIVNPKIGDDIKFEINANFMRELRFKLFAGTYNEDTYEHVRTVLEIVDLFHFPGVTHDKVHIFYTRLDISTRKILDSNGFIPLMTPTQALESIQVMADHSHDWYDETTTRERINDVLDNIYALHESFKGEHLTKEYPLKKEDEAITTIGKENMKEMVPRDLPPMPFLGHLKEQMGGLYETRETIHMIGNPEEIHNTKAQEDEGDMDVGWDITSKDVERLRDEEHDYDIPQNDILMQPLTPQTVYITPPDDDYVAPAANPMSNKQLNKFEEEFYNITKVSEKEYDNPVMKTYDFETFIRKLLHQVRQSSRGMKSQQQYGSNLSFPYPVANSNNHGVHCYSHSHLISSEGRNTLLLRK
ncbi:hypothetical protein Tco_0318588 [Tanacetum coccineum]